MTVLTECCCFFSHQYQGEGRPQHMMDTAFKNTTPQNVALYMATVGPGSAGYPSWTSVPQQTAVPIGTQHRDWPTNPNTGHYEYNPHVFNVGFSSGHCTSLESKNGEAVDNSSWKRCHGVCQLPIIHLIVVNWGASLGQGACVLCSYSSNPCTILFLYESIYVMERSFILLQECSTLMHCLNWTVLELLYNRKLRIMYMFKCLFPPFLNSYQLSNVLHRNGN